MSRPARGFDAYIKAPDPAIRLILVYGEDRGLVRERADLVSRAVVRDPKDPFRLAQFTAEALAADPARLNDEAAAIAFGGGRRVIRVTDCTNAQAKLFAAFLEKPMGDALVVVEAGELRKSNSLTKLAEAAANAFAVPCYADEDEDVGRVIETVLNKAGFAADDDAMAYLVGHLGADRALTRRELEKLVLYLSDPGRAAGPVSLGEAAACVGNSAGLAIDDLIFAVAEGQHVMVARSLTQLEQEGESAVGILRRVGTHFRRLHEYQAHAGAGLSPPDIMKRLRVFWKAQSRFQLHAQSWRGAALAEALRRLNEAEARCKTTGMPDAAVCGQTLLALAEMARRRRS